MMDIRFYQTQSLDLPRIAQAVVDMYQAQGYEAHQASTPGQAAIQLRKESMVGAILGFNQALVVTLQQEQGGTLVKVGVQDWLEQLTPATIGQAVNAIIHPVTMTIGAVRQHHVAEALLNFVDEQIRQQQPGVQEGVPPLTEAGTMR
jgi:hypothetical protein